MVTLYLLCLVYLNLSFYNLFLSFYIIIYMVQHQCILIFEKSVLLLLILIDGFTVAYFSFLSVFLTWSIMWSIFISVTWLRVGLYISSFIFSSEVTLSTNFTFLRYLIIDYWTLCFLCLLAFCYYTLICNLIDKPNTITLGIHNCQRKEKKHCKR